MLAGRVTMVTITTQCQYPDLNSKWRMHPSTTTDHGDSWYAVITEWRSSNLVCQRDLLSAVIKHLLKQHTTLEMPLIFVRRPAPGTDRNDNAHESSHYNYSF